MFIINAQGWTKTSFGGNGGNKWLTASTLTHAGGHKKVHSSC